MRFNLLTKYILLYICIGILGFMGVTFLSYRQAYNDVYSQYSDSLYRQALSIADEYADDYFSDEHLRIIEIELNTVSKLNNTRIMFIDTNGNVLLDTQGNKEVTSTVTNSDGTTSNVLYTINDFNYTNLGSNHSQRGNFYGLFDSSHISVFAPITSAFTTKGYVVVHIDENVIINNVYVTFNTNYFTFIIMMILGLGFIILYLIHIHKPLTAIAKATEEYSKGHLSYKLKPRYNDEIGNLALSLNYMAEKMEESDKFQQKFLSNISHDFRSPLTSIKGYLEAMSDGTIPPEMMDKYFGILLFETDRLTKLTSNILTLNELDPKTVSLEISSFDINAFIKHTIETFEGICKKKKIKFALTFANKYQYVKADKSKIGQVIYNLVDNAIKFSSEDSSIYITVREKGEKVYVSVKDTGSGIPKEQLNKIWERFYKSDSSRGRDKKGSGLGLSIAKEIIQAHGEHIDVVSTPGVGTEFTLSLTIDKNLTVH